MSGKPGRSGGRREGAGRPPQSFTLRPDHGLILWEQDANGNHIGLGRGAVVTKITTTSITLSIYDADQNPTGTLVIRRFT